MEITWLGQAGLLFETACLKIIVDPYLSDSIERLEPVKYRRMPVDERFLNVQPDILIFTHSHLDHFDPDTVKHYLNHEKSTIVLAPRNTWERAKKFGGNHNYVMFDRCTEWSFQNLRFRAVKAVHSDLYAIGIVMETERKKYYITGDTLYNTMIFQDIPEEIEVLFLPVNGTGNNMNMRDAERFSRRVNPKKTIPIHFGMFDDIDPYEIRLENVIVPKIYEKIRLL